MPKIYIFLNLILAFFKIFTKMRGMLKGLKRSFITGLIVLMPLGVTFFVIRFLLEKIGQPASVLFFGSWINNLDKQWVEFFASLLSILIVIGIITIFGWLSKFFLGKALLNFAEGLIQNIPFINTIYNTVKQIVGTIGQNKKAIFQKAVLVQFPSQGLYSIGFLTNRSKGETQEKTKENVCNVFVPTTPNPTSGFLIMVPENKLVILDMTVGDAIKLIISGGTVAPVSNKEILNQ